MTSGPIQQLFAQALASDTGLTFTAALAWASAEVGSLNNLGIMSGGKPVAYATPQAGAAAAAQLINTSPLYAGIRATVGQSAQAQMQAIATSPWHLGPSGLAAAGGTDPFYVKVFKLFGYVPGGTSTSGTTPPAAGGGSGGGTVAAPTGTHTLYDYLSQAGLSVTASETYAQVRSQALTTFSNDKQFQPWMRSSLVLSVQLLPYMNTPIGQIPWAKGAFSGTWNPIQPGGTNPPGYEGASGAIAGFFDWGAWLPGFLEAAAVLGVVLVLGYSGLEELLG